MTPPLEGATVDPVCEQAARDAASLLESLGHHVEEITPPWAGLDLLPDFTRAFGPLVSFTTWLGGQLTGREPTAEDVEPLTWTLYEHARSQDTIKYLTAAVPARVGGALDRPGARALRRRAHAGAGPAAGADRRDPRPGAGPDGQLPQVRLLHAVHRDLQRHRPAGDRAARSTTARTACPPRCSWSGRRRARRCCSAWPRSSRPRCRGPTGRRRYSARQRRPSVVPQRPCEAMLHVRPPSVVCNSALSLLPAAAPPRQITHQSRGPAVVRKPPKHGRRLHVGQSPVRENRRAPHVITVRAAECPKRFPCDRERRDRPGTGCTVQSAPRRWWPRAVRRPSPARRPTSRASRQRDAVVGLTAVGRVVEPLVGRRDLCPTNPSATPCVGSVKPR